MKIRRLFLSVSVVISCASSYAWTESETNAVGQTLAAMVALDPTDCCVDDVDEESEEPLGEAYPTFGSLFEATNDCISAEWSAEDRRNAFWHYVSTLPEQASGGVFTGNVWHATAALGFCCTKGDSSFLDPAMQIIGSDSMPEECKKEALRIVDKHLFPSEQNNLIVAHLVTNGCLDAYENLKSDMIRIYSRKLSAAYDGGLTNVAAAGAALLYGVCEGDPRAVSLDKLLTKTFTAYGMSSNRLLFALHALQDNPTDEWTGGYFISVTNLLMGGELPHVDGL